jgi:polysaccharide chain length determinant protein (PEP-CTERM system associated)
MLPGKKYKPEDVLQVLKRRFWVLVVPFAVISAGTAIVARKLPDRYMSAATILVQPQRVPEAYVKSAVSTNINDRLRSLQQQILSRTRLERIIEEFNLYPDERRSGIMEDVVEQMRTDINVSIRQGDVFAVAYYGESPRTVMRVTDRLASLFIDENLRERGQLAEHTNQFLETQVEDARRRLAAHEQKLQEYRLRHAGQLPSQLDANLQGMGQTMLQLQQISQSINTDREQRLFLDKQLKELEGDTPPDPGSATFIPATPDAPARVTGGTAAMQLDVANRFLQAMLLKYSEDHPDVKSQRRFIKELQEKADAEALLRPVTMGDAGLPPAEQARRRKIQDLKNTIENIDRNIAKKQDEDKRLRTLASSLQTKIDAAPMRESEMTELTRDYATLTQMYTGLLTKKEDSQIAANVERRQMGELLKILDPARLPESPASPNRPMINLFGMAAGLGVGVFLIALLEYRDATFKTDDEVTTQLACPVLAVVPLMQSDQDRRKATRRRWLMGFGLGSTVAGCLAIVVYTFVF